MTVLLVLFLILVFVLTDRVVRAASLRTAARRDAPQSGSASARFSPSQR